MMKAFFVLLCSFLISFPVLAQEEGNIAPVERFRPEIEAFTIFYPENTFALPGDSLERLSLLAERLRGTNDALLIRTYGGSAQLSTQEMLKLSFKRALLIRTVLMDRGVEAEQLTLEIKASPADDGNPNRADIQERLGN